MSFTCTFSFSHASLEAAGEGEKFVAFQSSEESTFLLPRSSVGAKAAKKKKQINYVGNTPHTPPVKEKTQPFLHKSIILQNCVCVYV